MGFIPLHSYCFHCSRVSGGVFTQPRTRGGQPVVLQGPGQPHRRTLSRVVGGGQPWLWSFRRADSPLRHGHGCFKSSLIHPTCLWCLGAEVTEVVPWVGCQGVPRCHMSHVWWWRARWCGRRLFGALCLLKAHEDVDGTHQHVKGSDSHPGPHRAGGPAHQPTSGDSAGHSAA